LWTIFGGGLAGASAYEASTLRPDQRAPPLIFAGTGALILAGGLVQLLAPPRNEVTIVRASTPD
jgi:hypothetical protein